VRLGVDGLVARRRRGVSLSLVEVVVVAVGMRNRVGLVGAVCVRWCLCLCLLETVVVVVVEEDDGLRPWREAIDRRLMGLLDVVRSLLAVCYSSACPRNDPVELWKNSRDRPERADIATLLNGDEAHKLDMVKVMRMMTVTVCELEVSPVENGWMDGVSYLVNKLGVLPKRMLRGNLSAGGQCTADETSQSTIL